MYDRRVNDTILTFGHSGRLYEQSFVFYDHQTNSQWVHVTGEAMTGPYKGTVLTFLPSTVTSWQEWKSQYPQTQVLPGAGRGGFMGTYRGFYDIEQIGLVISRFREAKLYPFNVLHDQPVINDTFNGNPIVVTYNTAQRTATAWSRIVEGKTLTFHAEYDPQRGFLIVDSESSSRWNPTTGLAIDGPYHGTELPALSYNPIRNDRFVALYPDGEIYSQ